MVEFQVLNCCMSDCKLYQVKQKKISKWSCAVCGTKQSVMRIHFESKNASDCRKYVQEMNRRVVMKGTIIDQSVNQEQIFKITTPKDEEILDLDHKKVDQFPVTGGIFKGICKRSAWEFDDDLQITDKKETVVIEKENHPTGSRWKQYDTSSSDSE